MQCSESMFTIHACMHGLNCNLSGCCELLLFNVYYRFDKNWLLPEYQESANVAKVKNERERKVLLGVHKRDHNNGNLAENPSKLDYETLNRAYEIPRFDNHYYNQHLNLMH